MITFVTVSKNELNVCTLRKSIKACFEGSGHRWTLRVADGKNYDLFSGYNYKTCDANGEYLAFIHDDAKLLGNRLAIEEPLKLLKKPSTGFVGVAGSRSLSKNADPWWQQPNPDLRGMAAHRSSNAFNMHWNIWPQCTAALFGRVAVLDGVLLMCHRRTFKKLGGFDDKNFKGFHFYDIDITFRATLTKLANYAAPIPLFHAGQGNLDDHWERNRRVFLSKFSGHLPYQIEVSM